MYNGIKVLDAHQHIVAPQEFGNFQRSLCALRWGSA